MKPAPSAISNVGTLTGASQTMTIQHDAMAHIMSVLTNLYSDARLAVLREYSTNALDAHREIGLDRPIEVSLPTDMKPSLAVEDFGVGMSTDEILNLYSSYGASTKRGTNEQTGMLGLGSKSALAYSPQFTVRSRKGGVETSALIYLNDRGEGEIKIVDTRSTSETGTRIEIPVTPKDIRDFREAAAGLFLYWTPAQVKVRGADVEFGSNSANWTWIADNAAISTGGYNSSYRRRRYGTSLTIVQGGVPYIVDSDKLSDDGVGLYNSLPLGYRDVVLIAPIGSLQFTPSRESLYYTPETNRAIESLIREFIENTGKFVSEKVESAKDKSAALDVAGEYEFLTPKGASVTWHGEKVPLDVPCYGLSTDTAKRAGGTTYKFMPRRGAMMKYDLIVYGASNSQATEKGSYQIRVNANGYISGTHGLVDRWYGQRKEIFIFAGGLPEGWDWYGLDAVHVDSLRPKSTKGTRASQAKTEYQERVWEVRGQGYGKTTKIDPEDDKVVYVSANERYNIRPEAAPNGWTVVMVPGNQHGRFAREFPKAMTPKQAAAGLATTITYTEADQTHERNAFIGVDSDVKIRNLLDPDLRTVLEWMSQEQPGVKAAKEARKQVAWLGVEPTVIEAKTPLFAQSKKRYGFLYSVHGHNLVTTINALYTYKYQGGTK